jgi:hypothetical protein
MTKKFKVVNPAQIKAAPLKEYKIIQPCFFEKTRILSQNSFDFFS